MPWLAMIFISWAYLSHFKRDFDCVKNIICLFNLCNLISYLASHRLVSQWLAIIFLEISSPLQVGFWWCEMQSWSLVNLTSYPTQLTKSNVPNQIYYTKFVPCELKQIYWIKFTKPNVQTKSTKLNLSNKVF